MRSLLGSVLLFYTVRQYTLNLRQQFDAGKGKCALKGNLVQPDAGKPLKKNKDGPGAGSSLKFDKYEGMVYF